jgi:CSLREA domain-containing protein
MSFQNPNKIMRNIFNQAIQTILLTFICTILSAATAGAATRIVTKTADTNDGVCNTDCSLREAIATASPGDTIIFASPLFDSPQIITLISGSGFEALNINKSLTITGRGADRLTVRRAPGFGFRIFNVFGSGVQAFLNNVTVSDGFTLNAGGGININSGAALTVNGCYFTGNLAAQSGGGALFVEAGSSLSLRNSTVSGNTASQLTNPSSGGIDNEGTLVVTNSTISDNQTTLSSSGGNGGDASGGGIYSSGTTTVTSSTVTDNQAAGATSASGIFKAGGTFTIRNTIIAANRENTTKPDTAGVFASDGYNLIGNAGAAVGFNQPGDQKGNSSSPLDPRLGLLADNGGSTLTYAPANSSPAIDKGNSFGETFDQRGLGRPSDNLAIAPAPGGDNADIGAVERPNTLTVTKIADTNDGVCDADCSLREAIAAASPAGDTIVFASPVFNSPQIITLSDAVGFQKLLINKSLTIVGRGADRLTVRRAPNAAMAFRIFEIGAGTVVSLSGMTITGGNVFGTGGGIGATGATLTVRDCYVTGNAATAGGGIGNSASDTGITGTLIVIGSTIAANTANDAGGVGGGGGGIHSRGNLTIKNSTVSGNVKVLGVNNGGGVWTNGTALISNSTITDNRTDTGASGLSNAGGTATIRSSLIAANRNNIVTPDTIGVFVSEGYNLVGYPFANPFNQPTDQTGDANAPLDPKLLPLAANGAATPTHGFADLNSPAIDKGNSFGETADQRGSLRPVDNPAIAPASGGDDSDIGAFEFKPALTVTKTEDTSDGVCDADCSLREAIAAAAPGDTIGFASPLFDSPQIITLSDAAGFRDLVINKNLIVMGKGANLLTVRRNPNAPVGFRIFTISGGSAAIVLSGMTITGGLDTGGGGGVLNDDGNILTISNCYVTGNTAHISGGGIRNLNAVLTLSGSTVSNNIAINIGGGGIHTSGGTLTVTNSTVSGNTKTNNDGSTGGIWANGGNVSISSSTIANNLVFGLSSAGGIYQEGSATVTIRNTIVAANVNNFARPDVVGAFTSQGYNLIGNVGTAAGFNQTGDQTGSGGSAVLDPKLAPLVDNGGTMPTHGFADVTSPAIDKGKSFGLTADQRGNSRPADFLSIAPAPSGDNSDIGAFELAPFLMVTKTEDTNDGACDADCSLREAIVSAGSGYIIRFASPLFDSAQTITLSDAAGFRALVIDKSLTIEGRGAKLLTVRRDPASAVNFNIFTADFSALALTLDLSGMTVSGGRLGDGGGGGGGIHFDRPNGKLNLTSCHVTGNLVFKNGGGGIESTAPTTVTDSTVSNNTVFIGTSESGGGLDIRAGGLDMKTSTISGNVVQNSNGNSAGGIYLQGASNIMNSTVTDNQGAGAGGIYAGNSLVIRGTIVAANRGNNTVPDVAANTSTAITSQGFNLVGNGGPITGFNQATDWKGTAAAPLDPRLQALADNGGQTPTHALLIGSPAIDSGNSFGETADQRGGGRTLDNPAAPPAVGGDNTDIGAFEAPRFAPLVVTKTADTDDGACDADCSLREAINAAAVRGQEIVFSALFDQPQTITLADATGLRDLRIFDKSLAIEGRGANLLTIRRDPVVPNLFSVFHIVSSSRTGVYLSGMTITGGWDNTNGFGGGGISSTAQNSILTVVNSFVTGNKARFGGGGIGSVGTLLIMNSTVSNNIALNGGVSLKCSGGIMNSSNSPLLVMSNSTVSGNTVADGQDFCAGGVLSAGPSSIITNSTITDNQAPGANSAGGLTGTGTIRGTIVAANRNNTAMPDVSGVFTSGGFNLIGNAGAVTVFNQPGDQAGTSGNSRNPGLDPLGSYGGTTPTHRLQTNSSAIDRGNSFGLTTDQRGAARPVNFTGGSNIGDNADIGAFELLVVPTAAAVTVSGKVLTPDGRGLTRARVVLTDSQGNTRTAISSSFGYYSFENVEVGQTYVFTVVSKSYEFAPQVVTVLEEFENLDFVALSAHEKYLPLEK